MPKTKLQTRQPPHAKLAVLLNGTVAVQELTTNDVAQMMGVSPPTALSRLRHPGNLTVDELTRLGKRAGIPIEDLRGAITY